MFRDLPMRAPVLREAYTSVAFRKLSLRLHEVFRVCGALCEPLDMSCFSFFFLETRPRLAPAAQPRYGTLSRPLSGWQTMTAKAHQRHLYEFLQHGTSLSWTFRKKQQESENPPDVFGERVR